MSQARSILKVFIVFFVILQPLLIVSTVYSAGFQRNENSPSLQGAAMAGAAAAKNDVSSIYNNPANLSTLLQNQIYVGFSGVLPNLSISDASATHAVNIMGIPPSNLSGHVQGSTAQDKVNNAILIPDIYLGFRINQHVSAGLSITEPFHLASEYNNDSVLRFTALKSKIDSVNINPILAYEMNTKISFAVGMQIQYLQTKFSNFNGPYTDFDSINTLISATSPTYFKVDGWGIGYTLGVLYQPYKFTRLGVSYRSQILNDLEGHGAYMTLPGEVVPAPSQSFWFNGNSLASMPITTPAVLTLGAAQDINDWTLKATGQLNFWNSFQQLSISMPQAFSINNVTEMHWKNAWFASIGADYRLNELFILRSGLAYDETPTNKNFLSPKIPDANRIWTTVGMSYKVSANIAIDGAYAYIFIKNQNMIISQASGRSISSTLPLEVDQARARYKGFENIVSLAIRYSC